MDEGHVISVLARAARLDGTDAAEIAEVPSARMATEQIRLATELNAAKFSWARRVGQDHTSVLRASTIKHLNSCFDDTCTGCCGECEEEEAPPQQPQQPQQEAVSRTSTIVPLHPRKNKSGDDDVDDDKSDDEDEEDEDVAEAKLLAKMRAARLSEMQDLAEAAKESLRAELGTHKRLRENESLASLLEASATIPVVLHVGIVTNDATVDNNLVLVVAEELKFAAPRFAGIARLVTDVCIDPLELPAWLQANTLPALVTLQNRAVVAKSEARLNQMPEGLVRETVNRWLASEKRRLKRQMGGS